MRLSVQDTGHGMDNVTIERIFEPFFTTKEVEEGAGMGLSIVHGIVKSYGGMISAYSEPGKGATFHVLLPKTEVDVPSSPPVSGYTVGGAERILLVDDEEAIMNLGRRMLEDLGYDVVGATSSIEALKIFRNQPDRFDLVITDQTMPKMTGEYLAREISMIRSDLPIILCSGFIQEVAWEEASPSGIREFVMKPFVRRQIAQTIRRVMDGRTQMGGMDDHHRQNSNIGGWTQHA
jgi:CheY-like chemotaxis protein